jgi:hypothetical protein
VALTFSLKYLINFTKATNLSSSVNICLSNDVPLLIDYTVSTNSYLRFYLAPKVFTPRRRTVLRMANSGSRLGTMSEVAHCHQIESGRKGINLETRYRTKYGRKNNDLCMGAGVSSDLKFSKVIESVRLRLLEIKRTFKLDLFAK